jgi:hypothetical protein
VLNGAGSAAFLLSALYTVVLPGLPDAHALWLGGFYTFVGGLFFLMGSYLLVPELFDGEARGAAPASRPVPSENIA